jgi:hypothetical protein
MTECMMTGAAIADLARTLIVCASLVSVVAIAGWAWVRTTRIGEPPADG